VNHGIITLRSGTWEWSHEGEGLIILRHTKRPGDELRMQRPAGDYTDETVRTLARDPDFRTWTDDRGVQWTLSLGLLPPGAFGSYAPELPHSADRIKLTLVEVVSFGEYGTDEPDLLEPPDTHALIFSRSHEELRVEVPVPWDLGDATDEELLQLRQIAESRADPHAGE
jgi:hypothetical protein